MPANDPQSSAEPVSSGDSEVARATETNDVPADNAVVNGGEVVQRRATVVVQQETNGGHETDEASDQEEEVDISEDADLLEDYPDDTEVWSFIYRVCPLYGNTPFM